VYLHALLTWTLDGCGYSPVNNRATAQISFSMLRPNKSYMACCDVLCINMCVCMYVCMYVCVFMCVCYRNTNVVDLHVIVYRQTFRSVKLTTGKNGKKTELTGKGPLRRRRSALD
jgi:hypothetical protein